MAKLCLVMMAFIVSSAAMARAIEPYSQSSFARHQSSGHFIAIQYHASWCPVCKKQKNALELIAKEKAYDQVFIVTADYDSEEALKKAYDVKAQSTIILLKGKEELGRLQGATDPQEIRQFFAKAK